MGRIYPVILGRHARCPERSLRRRNGLPLFATVRPGLSENATNVAAHVVYGLGVQLLAEELDRRSARRPPTQSATPSVSASEPIAALLRSVARSTFLTRFGCGRTCPCSPGP